MKFFTPAAAVASTLAVLLQTAAFVTAADATSGGLERRATVCNGHAELCEKSFGAVTFVGAHDSYAIGTGCEFALYVILRISTDEAISHLPQWPLTKTKTVRLSLHSRFHLLTFPSSHKAARRWHPYAPDAGT